MIYTLRIEPFVYINNVGLDVLFYNTLDGNVVEFQFSSLDVFSLSENILRVCVEEYDECITDLCDLLYHKHMAFLIANDSSVFSINMFDKLANDYIIKLNEVDLFKENSMLNDLVSITICMNGANREIADIDYLSKQFDFFSNFKVENGEIDIKTLYRIFDSNLFSNLKIVKIAGTDLLRYSYVNDFVYRYCTKYEIKVFLTYSEYINLNNKNEDIAYCIICDKQFVEHLKAGLCSFAKANLELYYFVKRDEDIALLEYYEDSLIDHNLRILPYYADNISFLKKMISYSKTDILDEIKSKNKIVRNGLINSFFYGEIIIHNNGNVFMDILSNPIGNIKTNSLKNILYWLSDKNSSWFLNRKKYFPCISCLYSSLCPPVSYIEIVTKNKYCTQPICGN